jgi:rhodanese-related sulfurtransferase
MKLCTFLLPISLLLASCMEKPAHAPQGPPPIVLPAHYLSLSPDEVEKHMQTMPDFGVIDVRDDHEIRDGNGWIKGAEPLSQLQGNRDQLAKLDRARPWLVYCAIGGRAELTAQTMAELGFEKVYLLQGGFIEWRAQGKPVVK